MRRVRETIGPTSSTTTTGASETTHTPGSGCDLFLGGNANGQMGGLPITAQMMVRPAGHAEPERVRTLEPPNPTLKGNPQASFRSWQSMLMLAQSLDIVYAVLKNLVDDVVVHGQEGACRLSTKYHSNCTAATVNRKLRISDLPRRRMMYKFSGAHTSILIIREKNPTDSSAFI